MRNLDYYSADLNSARAKCKVDLTEMPFENNSFDVIFSIHVLEHVTNDIHAIKELYRVQKPSGWSIHLVPINTLYKFPYEDKKINSNKKRQKIYGHHDHKRVCGLDYYDRFGQTLSSQELKKFGIDPVEKIYLCKKNSI